MKACGIIAEYNPFHKGHYLHIKKTKQLLGDDICVICCMSGNYTQRGEASILPKHIRAQTAIACGADLVIELPSAYSLLSAEGFAKAGVYILNSLGIVTDLSFGAECADTTELIEIAKVLNEHEVIQETLLQLKSGVSYAAAREKALYNKIKEKSSIISTPNNILGIEYIKALLNLDSHITPHAIARIGANHDSNEISDGILSASAIRLAIRDNSFGDIGEYLPIKSYELIKEALKNGMCMQDNLIFERNMFSYLLRLSPEDFQAYPDVSEGLEYRIVKSLRLSSDIYQAIEKTKSKRYPESRIRRILLRAYLGLTSDFNDKLPEYCRVIAFNNLGRQALAEIRKKSSIPVVTKTAHISDISESANKLFTKESICSDLYFSALPSAKNYFPGSDWRTPAIRL